MPPIDLVERLVLLLALTLFLGLAFEEIYKRDEPAIPGGIRKFPLVGLAGALRYIIEPQRALAFYRRTARDRGVAPRFSEARAAGGSRGGQDLERPDRQPPRSCPRPGRLDAAGVIAATAMMYPRTAVVIAFFSPALAMRLVPALILLSSGGGFLAWWEWHRIDPGCRRKLDIPTTNPLQITAAVIFTAVFLAVSLATTWTESTFGQAGVFTIAAIAE
jgi:hypothetical protein